ncbi:hypothetical protein [Kribbella sp. NPDC048915]|uniref:hypothetical protein n=1 Tax=Kribbella sp. NPDC048915 TaxID=3155148 RepID=UPI0033D1181E
MFRPTMDSRIYLLDEDERQTTPGGPAVVGPDGRREEIPPAVYRAISHVLEAMRAGHGVKIVPLRPELPIDEAAAAIGMGRDDLRKNVAQGAVPFRSTEHVDWVRLADLIEWDNRRYAEQQAALDELMGGDPDDDETS